MHTVTLSLLGLAAIVPIQAFTNGSLIPAYFCNPVPDGMPKSLGQLIPFTLLDKNTDLAFNANVTNNLAVVPVTNSTPGNAGYILASFHNTNNRITPLQQGMKVTTISNQALQAGKPNPLLLSSGSAGVALDGALIYAKNATGQRVGTFTDATGTFKAFMGCGKNAKGQWAGVVHQQLISCNVSSLFPTICGGSGDLPEAKTRGKETYTGLSFVAPSCGDGKVTLAGLSVTDNGFGVWNVTMTVDGQKPFDKDGDCDGMS